MTVIKNTLQYIGICSIIVFGYVVVAVLGAVLQIEAESGALDDATKQKMHDNSSATTLNTVAIKKDD